MSKTYTKCGHYLGTEKENKWWRRYREDGYLARGIGEFWLDDKTLFFKRNLTQKPLTILIRDIVEVKTGKWHSGRWAGGAPVVKVVWNREDTVLSSGFVFSREGLETAQYVQRIEAAMSKEKQAASE